MKSFSLLKHVFIPVVILTATQCDNGNPGPVSRTEPVSQKWILGRVELPADATSFGLIGFAKTDVFWIPYQYAGEQFDLHDTVYFRIQHVQVDTSGKMALASEVTRTRPASSDLCTGRCISDSWINGMTFVPHKMFTHVGGSTYHKPGHIIQSPTPPAETITLQVLENGQEIQTQEYQLQEVQYQDSGDRETVYVPTDWVEALSDPDKNYYLDFYDTKVRDKRVLRSYSIDHTHPGHISNITVKEQ
jgi:hypothetical protein